jgi:uncharacterized protein YjbI with pentapeptide repeats
MLELLLSAVIAAAPASEPARLSSPDCQSTLGPLYEGPEEADLPGQVDGAAIANAAALVALRAERGGSLIIVRGGSFANADFRGADLHNFCFLDTNLAGSDWRGADASGAGFVRADLTGANLSGADLSRVLFRHPNMKDADASGADLSGGRLDGGWDGSLENLRLDGADLSAFRFDCGITLGDGCPLDRAISFRRADLSGAAIATYGRVAALTGARIDRTEVALDQLDDLRDADIAGPLLVQGAEAPIALSPPEYARLAPHVRPPQGADQPSFDCARAATRVERALCGEYAGRARELDRSVADLFRRAVAADPAIAAAQQVWLRERDRCGADGDGAEIGCLQESYESRRAELIARIGPPTWLRPGAIALFVAPPIGFDEAFRSDPLHARLLPAMIGASWSEVVVRTNADGTIDARGGALAANAHTCSLAGDGLSLDRATGYYSGPHQGSGDEPPAWRGRPMPVLLLWDDRADVYQAGRIRHGEDGSDPRPSDYASCGARAGFSEMLRMPVSDAEAARRFDSLGEP